MELFQSQNATNKPFLMEKDYRYDFLVKSIESIDDYAILMLDAQGLVQTWNHGARKIKGYLSHEILSQHFSIFYTSEESSRLVPDKELEIVSHHGRFECEGWRVRKNGEKFWANIVITAMKDQYQNILAFSMVVRDLSEKKMVEEKLKCHEEFYENDKKIISELEESIRMRDEFISVASHELRTPVTRILLNLQLMKRTSDELKERMIKSIDVCESSTKELISLMDNLVDVTRLRLGKLEVKRTKTNITSIVLNVITKFKDQIRLSGNHVSFTHDGDLIGYWDQVRLEQLFSNLFSNAVKFGDGKPIKMELRLSEDRVKFMIQDEGPGIPRPLQTKVFERFGRAVDSKKISGLGLGLYVSKQIVEAHKGEISLKSEKGLGTTFTVDLPLKQEKR